MIGNKQRPDHTESAEVLEVIGHVQDKNVLMVDDFTITGGSLISMAELLKQRGARDVYAAVSHGVLSKGAAARIGASEIKEMFVTDTIENQFDSWPANVTVISVAPVVRPGDPFDSRSDECFDVVSGGGVGGVAAIL